MRPYWETASHRIWASKITGRSIRRMTLNPLTVSHTTISSHLPTNCIDFNRKWPIIDIGRHIDISDTNADDTSLVQCAPLQMHGANTRVWRSETTSAHSALFDLNIPRADTALTHIRSNEDGHIFDSSRSRTHSSPSHWHGSIIETCFSLFFFWAFVRMRLMLSAPLRPPAIPVPPPLPRSFSPSVCTRVLVFH